MSYVEWRCSGCGQMLGRVDHRPGSRTEVKCAKCNTVNTMIIYGDPRAMGGPYEKRVAIG